MRCHTVHRIALNLWQFIAYTQRKKRSIWKIISREKFVTIGNFQAKTVNYLDLLPTSKNFLVLILFTDRSLRILSP